MEADLYNLQPTIGEINQQRQNFKMSIIPGEKRNFGKCDFEVQNKFVEPSPNIRGDIARTYFYMADTYSKYIRGNWTSRYLHKLIFKFLFSLE